MLFYFCQHFIKDSTMNFTLLKEKVRAFQAEAELYGLCKNIMAKNKKQKKQIKSIKEWMNERNGVLQNGKSQIFLIEMRAA